MTTTIVLDATLAKMLTVLSDSELSEVESDTRATLLIIEAEQIKRRGFHAHPYEDES